MKKIIPYIVIFNISGLIYAIIELLWRGYTHWTMYVCAGIAGLLIAKINDGLFEFETDFRVQVLTATFFCTLCEFIFGLAFNRDYSIWDYRELWGTLEWTYNQVNILFIGAWMIICIVSIPFLDWLEWKLGIEEKPYYRIGKRYFFR